VRVAVIGCGSMGRRHIRNLLALGCDVDAYDPDSLSRAQARIDDCHLRVYAIRHDRIDVDQCPDAYVIATPVTHHLLWVEEAVRSRTPFFVEKPLGTLEQLPRWRELANQDLPTNQVGYNLRFQRHAQQLHAAVAPAPRYIECYLHCDMRTWPGKHYGPMLLECSHEIDLALWCGAPNIVSKAFRTNTSAHIYLGHNARVIINDAVADYYREWSASGEIYGYRRSFIAPEELGDEMYRDEIAHFISCVREQKPTRCPLTDGLRVLEVCAQVEAVARFAA
jgi:predicted dehydrogenase